MNKLGNYLRELRGKKSLRDVTRDTAISHTYLSILEKGYDPRSKKTIKPTTDVLKKLSSFYGVQYIDLLILAGYMDEEFDRGFNEPSDTIDLFELIEQDKPLRYANMKLDDHQRADIVKMIDTYLDNQAAIKVAYQ